MPRYVVTRPAQNAEEAVKDFKQQFPKAKKVEAKLLPRKKNWRLNHYKISCVMEKVRR